jgi:ectoine hydroxylase-related dioxygenase (phytanoyl-CoA dioxygenase family)
LRLSVAESLPRLYTKAPSVKPSADVRMCKIFRDERQELLFRENGFVIVDDLLHPDAIADLWAFYARAFRNKREVVPYACELPYYISIFDRDSTHKREVDERISSYVQQAVDALLLDYEVFYSNFMIKFPDDGQIEAHQDFNFVDENHHTAFNLWCPLVDTDSQNGGLHVIAGSHSVFTTQRGPNLPKALTQYNDLLKRYSRCLPLKKGQAVLFDHKLVHYSPPNCTQDVRVAIQSVLKPREAAAIHYVYDQPTGRVRAHRVDKDFILENDLWSTRLHHRTLDHEQPLTPFPTPAEVTDKLVGLAARQGKRRSSADSRTVLRDHGLQRELEESGFVTLPLLGPDAVQHLTDLFIQLTGGVVENTAYGMYIGLEDTDLRRKRAVIEEVSSLIVPRANEHFLDCKPHLGSFLVKAPGADSYTYPHQDWTFVDPPRYRSMTVWVALVEVHEENGAMGFVRGSHEFFHKPIGSPSPDFRTCTQGHETILYEYLEFVPLQPGQAVVFDNRTIHGATSNRTNSPRIAVAIGMTPREAQLYHYFLVPQSLHQSRRKLAKLKVDAGFFERNTVASFKKLFDANQIPEDCGVESILADEFLPFTGEEVRKLCERSGLRRNGRRLEPHGSFARATDAATGRASRFPMRRVWKSWLRLE